MRLYNMVRRGYWAGFSSELEQAQRKGPSVPCSPRTLTPRETDDLCAELWDVPSDSEKTTRIRLHLSEENKDVTCHQLVLLFSNYRSEEAAGELIASVWGRIVNNDKDRTSHILCQGSEVIQEVVDELR